MKKLQLTLSILIIFCLMVLTTQSIYCSSERGAEKAQEVESVFHQMVDLWYDQKFDELYERFSYREKGAVSKKKFIARMTREKKRLACCWQKVQNVKIKKIELAHKLSSSGKAVVSARLGFEEQSNVEFVNAELPFYLKDETWVIKMKDILSTAPDLPKYKSKKKKQSKSH
ncbi:MAG: hypothetical protein HY266_00415 [Deltaproteobacteria bacterium]|nr:hypothetical protein [Deltaproteobacteria bacterium]